jgi:hypothetical protein
MENLFVAATNLYGLRAIKTGIQKRYWKESIMLGCAMYASIIYHLSETKHNMNSLILTNNTSVTLNIDRLFAFCSMALILFNLKNKLNKKMLIIGTIGLISMMISESQHVITLPMFIEKPLYLVTHSIWHICAFHTAHLLFI